VICQRYDVQQCAYCQCQLAAVIVAAYISSIKYRNHLKQSISFQMSPRPRRRSIDSSDSDSSDSSHKAHKKDKKYNKKDKKHKEHKHQETGDHHGPSLGHGSPTIPNFPSAMSHFPLGQASFPMPDSSGHGSPAVAHDQAPAMPHLPSHHDSSAMNQFPPSGGIDEKFISHGAHSSPPPYSTAPAQPAPPSGFRIALTATGPFPDPQTLGQPPCYDADGSPIYIGSALLDNSVHPCKIGKHLQPYAAVPYGGAEYGHHGRYDLLPYRQDQMEFVPTSYGRIPPGRRPIEGGYEDHGTKLYHAVALINGIRVPGKTAEHLSVFSLYLNHPFYQLDVFRGGCNVAFGGAEHVIKSNYEILYVMYSFLGFELGSNRYQRCWR